MFIYFIATLRCTYFTSLQIFFSTINKVQGFPEPFSELFLW